MLVRAVILEGPLPPLTPAEAAPDAPPPGVGARLVFEGIVRPTEAGAPIDALTYQVYDPMATTVLQRLGDEIALRHGLLGLRVWHSRGRVPAGACSFRLEVWSAHRAEALLAMGEFIDRLKRDVPIWKLGASAAQPSRA
ncbi:MAG: molybdenum cofactor biosynthesis protein MoaE [Phycisphaerales bacterium]